MAKKALVTGASDGIGKVFALELAKQGYVVTAVARNADRLGEVVKTMGAGHRSLIADLSTAEGQSKACQELAATKYDLLINNAGVGTSGAFTEVPLEKQMAMVRLNCEAVVALSHTFLKTAKSGDALMNVSSTLAFLPMPLLGLYCATKAFVTSFSESLWFEQKKKGVHVMDLCPGITSTSFQVNAGGRKEDVPESLAQTPEQVVAYALKQLASRQRPTVISGSKNRTLAFVTRLMPRSAVVRMMGKMGA